MATTLGTARAALAKADLEASDIAALGITNQRETTLIWDRASGRPIYNAIVWQDRRTAAHLCARLRRGPCGACRRAQPVAARSVFLRDQDRLDARSTSPAPAHARRRGELAFGTVDSFLLWRLTDGAVHATDATNASRTLLCDIRSGTWDDGPAARCSTCPPRMLPEVRDCAGDFGATRPDLLGGAIAIRGVAGDQQAALIGQACFAPGMVKATYGTGCFVLLNTGDTPMASRIGC